MGRRTAAPASPYDQNCPQCGAPAGRGCVDARWHPLPQAHQARGTWRANGPRDQQYPNLEVNEAKGVRKQLALREHEPEEEILDLAEEFLRKKDYLRGQIGRTPDINQFKTSPELRAFLMQHATSLRIIDVQKAAAEAAVIYDSPNWLVVLPESLEASIHYGKGTTWCTARTDGSNLFYNYVGSTYTPILLYYMLNKRDTTSAVRKLSLGIINGQPVYQGGGGITVDADNGGVDEAGFRRLLGAEFDPIFNAVHQHSVRLGKHPALQHLEMLLQHPAKFRKYFKALDKDAQLPFVQMCLKSEVPDSIVAILCRESPTDVRVAVAKHYRIKPEYLLLLAQDKEPVVRAAVAANYNAPLEFLPTLAKDPDPTVRAATAANYNASPEILPTLAGDPATLVRVAAAANRNTPLEILPTLAGDPEPLVRAAAAANDRIPSEILAMLARDPASSVRIVVAHGYRAPRELLPMLARDPDAGVRRTVASHKALAVEDRLRLLLDPDTYVNWAAVGAADPEQLLHWMQSQGGLHKIDSERRAALARRGGLPVAVYTALARDPDRNVRYAVAGNVDAHPAVIQYLVSDPQTHYAATSTLGHQQRISEDRKRQRQQQVEERPARQARYAEQRQEEKERRARMPPAEREARAADMRARRPEALARFEAAEAERRQQLRARQELAHEAKQYRKALKAGVTPRENPLSLQEVQELSFSPIQDDRLTAAHRTTYQHGAAGESILIRLAYDPDEEVRKAVSWNDHTPRPIVEMLARQDPSEVVRERARQRLPSTEPSWFVASGGGWIRTSK